MNINYISLNKIRNVSRCLWLFLNASILYGYVCEFKDIGLCYENVLLMFKIDKIEKKTQIGFIYCFCCIVSSCRKNPN